MSPEVTDNELERFGRMETYASRDEHCSSNQRHIKDPSYESYNILRRDEAPIEVASQWVRTPRESTGVAIEKLGAGKNDSKVTDVTVVFCASHPTERGLRIIGFYRNATVLRSRAIST